MKIPEGDGAFDKAWKIKLCPHCTDKKILFFKEKCHECSHKIITKEITQMKTERKEFYFMLGMCMQFCIQHFGDGGWKTWCSIAGMILSVAMLMKAIEKGETKNENED